MSINPRDYDLEELRRMARERGGTTRTDTGPGSGTETDVGGRSDAGPAGGSGADGPDRSRAGRDRGSRSEAGASFRAELYRELLPLEAGGDATKPYLPALPDSYAGEQLVFEWLEFLLRRAGYKGTRETLEYYRSVGWLSETAVSTLDDYLLGLDEPAADQTGALDTDDHLLSLVYIGKLAAAQ